MSTRKDLRCDVCETPVFERNHYFTGKLMVPRDFCAEQDYFNQKRWLINRSLFGWGVVCGLDVKRRGEDGRLLIEPGLALDCCGHEILVCEELCIGLESLREQCSDSKPGSQHHLVVCLEYRDCKTEPVVDPTSPDCEGSQKVRYNRIRDSYHVRIRPLGELCLHHERTCFLDELTAHGASEGSCRTPSLHEYLCQRSKTCAACDPCDCIALAELTVTFPEKPGHPYQDDTWQQAGEHPAVGASAKQRVAKPTQGQHQHPVPEDECEEPEPPTIEIDTCTVRRLVYPNPLLHELIACFHPDAPRIVRLEWRDAVKQNEVEYSVFADLIRTGRIAVVFNQPIDADTLHPRSFMVTVFIRESGTGYRVRKYVPCRGIEYRTDEANGCYTAVFLPEHDWVRDELTGRHSELEDGVDVEIILRGSMITGTNGLALDGEYINGRLPSGNGVQAGDFVDWFTVGSRESGRKGKGAEGGEEAKRFEDF